MSADSFARLVSSNVRARVAGPLYWWDIYMRSRRGRSGTPVDFLPRGREMDRSGEGEYEGRSCSRHSRILFVLEGKKEILGPNLPLTFYPSSFAFLSKPDTWATRVVFLTGG